MNESAITDHESILLLRQDVKALKESQDVFHKEMKDSFRDLKDNYATRLDVVEKGLNDATSVYLAKSVQDKINEEVFGRIDTLENWKNWTIGLGIGITTLIAFSGVLIGYIYVSHVNSNESDIAGLRAEINSLITPK